MESLKKQFQGAMRLFRHGNLAVSLPRNDGARGINGCRGSGEARPPTPLPNDKPVIAREFQ